MKTLDRYVWRELLTPFLFSLLISTFLLLVDRIFDLINLIITKGVPVHLVLLLLTHLLPSIMVLTIPIGFFFAILWAFGRLSGDMEVVALKACGVSPLRLLRPVVMFGVVATIVTGYLMIETVPRMNYAFKALIFDIVRSRAAVGLNERVFNDTFSDFVIYVDEMAADQVTLRHVFVSDERKPEETRLITAREGRLITDEVNRRVTLRLLDGSIHETSSQALQKYREVSFRLYDITLVLDNPIMKQAAASRGDREMTLGELQSAATAARGVPGGNAAQFDVEIHKKFAIPAACLVFSVLGVPLGIRAHRGGRWVAFVAFLPVILVYYVGLTLGETLGDHRRVPAWVAMWTPNAAMGAVAGYLLWAAVQERPIPLVAGLQRLFWQAWAWVLRAGQRRPVRSPARRASAGVSRVRRAPRSNALHVVDRYLSLEFLSIFAYGLVLTAVIVIIGDLMTTLERYIRLKPSIWFILQHYVYRTPPFVYQGLHIVVLMTTILLFLGLSRSNELTAMKAGGISLYRVSLPIFGLALAVTLGGLAFQELVMPKLNQWAVEVDEAKIKRRTLPEFRKRAEIWYRGRDSQSADSRIYHIDLLDPVNREASNVSIIELGPEFSIRRRWDARGMAWEGAEESWRLVNGVRREFTRGRPDRMEAFREQTIKLPERFQDFAQIPRAPDVMNYVELREYVDRLRAGGHKVGKYLVDLYSKIAFPFAHPIMALVGIPFALQSPRGGRVIGIALCLVLGLGYFIVHSAALALARTDILPPMVAAWAANFLFATLGLFLFLRART